MQLADGDWRGYNCSKLHEAVKAAGEQLVSDYKASPEYQQGQLGREADVELHWDMLQKARAAGTFNRLWEWRHYRLEATLGGNCLLRITHVGVLLYTHVDGVHVQQLSVTEAA